MGSQAACEPRRQGSQTDATSFHLPSCLRALICYNSLEGGNHETFQIDVHSDQRGP